MNKWIIGAVVYAAACGAEGIREGTYDVTFRELSDTCGLPPPEGTEWRLSEADGDWTLTNTRNDFSASGSSSGDGLRFTTTRSTVVDGCTIAFSYEIELEPDRDGFVGTVTLSGAACDGSTCSAVLDADGVPN